MADLAEVTAAEVILSPSTPAEAVELLPLDLQTCIDKTNFLLYSGTVRPEEDYPQHMMIFSSPHGRERLLQANVWLADGTFKTTPTPWAQIYIIFAQMASGAGTALNTGQARYCRRRSVSSLGRASWCMSRCGRRSRCTWTATRRSGW